MTEPRPTIGHTEVCIIATGAPASGKSTLLAIIARGLRKAGLRPRDDARDAHTLIVSAPMGMLGGIVEARTNDDARDVVIDQLGTERTDLLLTLDQRERECAAATAALARIHEEWNDKTQDLRRRADELAKRAASDADRIVRLENDLRVEREQRGRAEGNLHRAIGFIEGVKGLARPSAVVGLHDMGEARVTRADTFAEPRN